MQEQECVIDFYVSGQIRVFDIAVSFGTDKFNNKIRNIWMGGYISPLDNKWFWKIYDYTGLPNQNVVLDYYSLRDHENYEEMLFQISLIWPYSINIYLVLEIQKYVNENYDTFKDTETRKVMFQY